ncbi:MAG TPA: hypothetical protein VKZ53_23250 [Candidatus Angelobacter sp.]|nr:hypothetical protein [Candidatus Angelobacter sp.]
MTKFVYPFLALSVIGFAAALAIHVAALFGITYPFDHFFKVVFFGLFGTFIPMAFVMNQLTRDFKQKEVWSVALRGCPRWMRRALWTTIGYIFCSGFILPPLYRGAIDSPGNTARFMAAGLMAFYATTFSVLYSATKVHDYDEFRRCPLGHRVSPVANFCEECGAQISS